MTSKSITATIAHFSADRPWPGTGPWIMAFVARRGIYRGVIAERLDADQRALSEICR